MHFAGSALLAGVCNECLTSPINFARVENARQLRVIYVKFLRSDGTSLDFSGLFVFGDNHSGWCSQTFR